MAAVYSRAYDRLWVPDRDSMMLERHAGFLRELGDEEAEALLPRALPKPRLDDLPEDYFVICPGASAAFKRWPAVRFAEVARRISEKTSWGVVLVGGAGEEEAARSVLSLIPTGTSTVDLVGKTGFSEWSAVVQHARLVIGNDSATLHLAAAHSTPAVCIAGVYDKNQFFPYRVDRLRKGERLPLTAMSDRPCAWCRTRGYFPGYGNRACAKSIRGGGCAHCVADVSVDEVLLCSEKAVEKGFE